MVNYHIVKVNVSDNQVRKIEKAVKDHTAVVIRLSHSDLTGEHAIGVTTTQANNISRCREAGVGMDLKMSKTQLRHNRSIEGGFIGAIIPFLARAGAMIARTASKVAPAIGRTVSKIAPKIAPIASKVGNFAKSTLLPGLAQGAAGAAGDFAVSKIIESATKAPAVEPNVVEHATEPAVVTDAIKGKGLYLKHRGSGLRVRKVGKGMFLAPWKGHRDIYGSGLYLRPHHGKGYVDGTGLIFGENSPIKDIPILNTLLGWLL